MSSNLSKQSLKEKWLKKYIDEMNLNQERKDNEKFQKIREEREYLDNVKRELEEMKLKKHFEKLKYTNDRLEDYNKSMNKKRMEEQLIIDENMTNKGVVSLNLYHEERRRKLDDYQNSLSENVDKNMLMYKDYIHGVTNKYKSVTPGNYTQPNNPYPNNADDNQYQTNTMEMDGNTHKSDNNKVINDMNSYEAFLRQEQENKIQSEDNNNQNNIDQRYMQEMNNNMNQANDTKAIGESYKYNNNNSGYNPTDEMQEYNNQLRQDHNNQNFKRQSMSNPQIPHQNFENSNQNNPITNSDQRTYSMNQSPNQNNNNHYQSNSLSQSQSISKPVTSTYHVPGSLVTTDVTNNELNYHQFNSKDYNGYQKVKKDILNFNSNVIKEHDINKSNLTDERRRIIEERLKELDKSQVYTNDLKKFKYNQQMNYKAILDNQVGERYMLDRDFPKQSQILSQSSFNPLSQSQVIARPIHPIDNNIFENHTYKSNHYKINVNPYSEKNYNIGSTSMAHNTILNPVPNYRNNKYLYNNHSSLAQIGNNIIR